MRGAALGAGCTTCMTFAVPVSGFPASSAVGPAGSRHGSDTRVTDPHQRTPGGSKSFPGVRPDRLRAPKVFRNNLQSAQPWLSTCWLAVRPISMSSRISSAVSA